MSDNKKERLAAIIREALTKENGKITAEFLKNKLSAANPSLREGDFIALSYIINLTLEKTPGIISNLEDFIENHEEIQKILGYDAASTSSSSQHIKTKVQPDKRTKKKKNKIIETEIILNKMIDQRDNTYKQYNNPRSL